MILANSAQQYDYNLPVIVGRWVSQITAQSAPCQATPATPSHLNASPSYTKHLIEWTWSLLTSLAEDI